MKLADIETFVVGTPPPGFGGRYFIFVALRTACGITGYGEIYSASFSPHLTAKMAEDMFARYLEGTDPHNIEMFIRRAHGSGFSHRPDPTVWGVASGLEIAMMDILGKAHDMPCYDLLGGKVQERLRTYTYLYPESGQDAGTFYSDPLLSAECAARNVADGFTAVKFDPAGQYTVCDGRLADREALSRSRDFCRHIRDAVGDKADMLFGTHGQFTAAGALQLADAIAPFGPLWFEEPVPPDNPAEMAKVARASSIPIAAGERLCGASEFAAFIDAGAVAIVQPNLGRAGGMREAVKIAALAAVRHVMVAPHLYCGPIVAAANIQFATAIPNFLLLESIQKMDGFHSTLLTTPLTWEDGYILPSDKPGLGVELNEDVARAHPYDGHQLHLEMGQNPYNPRIDQPFAGG